MMMKYRVEIIYLNGDCGPFTDTYIIEASSKTEAENILIVLIEWLKRFYDIISCEVVSLLP